MTTPNKARIQRADAFARIGQTYFDDADLCLGIGDPTVALLALLGQELNALTAATERIATAMERSSRPSREKGTSHAE